MYALRVFNSTFERLQIRPYGILRPGSRSITWSIGPCGAWVSALCWLNTSTLSLYHMGLLPPSSVGTVPVPASACQHSLSLGIWHDGKECPRIAGHAVCPETSQATLLHNSHRDLASQQQSFKDPMTLFRRNYRHCSVLAHPALSADCLNLIRIFQSGKLHCRSQQSTAMP